MKESDKKFVDCFEKQDERGLKDLIKIYFNLETLRESI